MEDNKEFKHFKSRTPLMVSLLHTLVFSILTVLLLFIYLNTGIKPLLIIGLIFGILGFLSLITSVVFLIIYQETVNAIKRGKIVLGNIIEINDLKKSLFKRNDYLLRIRFYSENNKLSFFNEYVTKEILDDEKLKIDSKVEVIYFNNRAALKNLI